MCFISFTFTGMQIIYTLSSYLFHVVFSVCGTAFWLQGLCTAVCSSFCCTCTFSCSAACGTLAAWPRIETLSPALEGKFLTTGPPGKSHTVDFLSVMMSLWYTRKFLNFYFLNYLKMCKTLLYLRLK